MCCTIGHPCDCRPETEDVICQDCHIAIPNTGGWAGLCRSCAMDRRIAEGQDA
jgi:hypothetical protein